MHPIFKYFKEFFAKEFNLYYTIVIIVMLGVLIYFNYWHGLEKRYAAGGKTKLANFAGYYLLYLVPFASAFFLQLLFFKDSTFFKNGWFWVILLVAPALFSFRVNFNFHQEWVLKNFAGAGRAYYLYCINWIVRVFVLVIPVCVIWLIKDREIQPLYGIRPLDSLKPYLIMLLAMIPLIAWASTQTDFLRMYPKAQLLTEIPLSNRPVRYFLFELSYGFDFVGIEMFFRGFLILSLAYICGHRCIIPVACFYCTIHFGKPMAECISSFFGGMLLGIISFNTGSIWGGLIAHLGIAWMMEAGGFIGNIFNKTK